MGYYCAPQWDLLLLPQEQHAPGERHDCLWGVAHVRGVDCTTMRVLPADVFSPSRQVDAAECHGAHALVRGSGYTDVVVSGVDTRRGASAPAWPWPEEALAASVQHVFGLYERVVERGGDIRGRAEVPRSAIHKQVPNGVNLCPTVESDTDLVQNVVGVCPKARAVVVTQAVAVPIAHLVRNHSDIGSD